MSNKSKQCSCVSCVGPTCKCGCQNTKAADRAPNCQCGDSCNCFPVCNCKPKETAKGCQILESVSTIADFSSSHSSHRVKLAGPR
jgi:hypothetical protein